LALGSGLAFVGEMPARHTEKDRSQLSDPGANAPYTVSGRPALLTARHPGGNFIRWAGAAFRGFQM